jgi:hypothetical protein
MALVDLVPIHMMFRTYIMFYIHMMTKDVMEIDVDAHHLLIYWKHAYIACAYIIYACALAGTNFWVPIMNRTELIQ